MGDGLAVGLPPDLVEALSLREGDEVEIRPVASRERRGTEELMAELRMFRGRLPVDFEFARDEANVGIEVKRCKPCSMSTSLSLLI